MEGIYIYIKNDEKIWSKSIFISLSMLVNLKIKYSKIFGTQLKQVEISWKIQFNHCNSIYGKNNIKKKAFILYTCVFALAAFKFVYGKKKGGGDIIYLLAVYCLITSNSLWFRPLGWPPGPPNGEVAEVGDPPLPPTPVPEVFFKSDWKKFAKTSWDGAFCWLGFIGDVGEEETTDAVFGVVDGNDDDDVVVVDVGVVAILPLLPPGDDKGDIWPFLLLIPFISNFSKLRS